MTNAHRQQRARILIKRVTRLAGQFPEFGRLVDCFLDDLEHQANRTPETDRQLVLSAIHHGAWTMEDLESETNLTRAEIQRILDALLAARIIIDGGRHNEKNSNGGRPKRLYLPAPNLIPAK